LAQPSTDRESARAGLEAATGDAVVIDVGALTEPDCATLDVLARLALRAQRRGRRIVLRNACPALRELIELGGLTDVLPCTGESGREAGR
jgi:anti-anti-sigma factor